jgi:LPS sulfotransferase NodH
MNHLRLKGLAPRAQDFVERAWLDLRSIGGSRAYCRFVVVGIARTGSTLLTNLLNLSPGALAYGELFRRPTEIGWDIRPFASRRSDRTLALYRSAPLDFLDRMIFRSYPRSIRAVGFKLFYYHAEEPPFRAVWQRLEMDKSIHVIHLRRRNILAQLLSLKVAERTQMWASTSTSGAKVEPLALDPDECARHFDWVRGLEEDCADRFGDHPVLDLDYENLVGYQDKSMVGVQHFLGLPPVTGLVPNVKRQRSVPLAIAVANYDELMRRFRRTAWSEFFDTADVAAKGGA